MGHARTHVVRKVSVFCFCVILCGICAFLFYLLYYLSLNLFYFTNNNNNNYEAINFGNKIQRYYATLKTCIIIIFFSVYILNKNKH